MRADIGGVGVGHSGAMHVDFQTSVSAALDPVMLPAGFAAGQGGDLQVIFCAAHDEFSDRFPALPQANEQDRGRGCCIDLVIEDQGSQGLRLDLEGHSLTQTLRAAHLHDEAAVVADVAGSPLDTVLAVLAHALATLFGSRPT